MKRSLEDGPKAYNALLTLLDSGNGKRKKAASEPKEIQGVAAPSASIEEFIDLEGEEEEQDDEEEEVNVEDDNEGDSRDPFEVHFAAPPAQVLEITDPKFGAEKWPLKSAPKSTMSLPVPPIFDAVSPKPTKLSALKLKYRLEVPWKQQRGEGSGNFTSLQSQLATPLFNYNDILFTQRNLDNAVEIRELATLHLLNHVFKTRDRVIKNNHKLAQSEDPDLECKDQGFTRPKVLVLLPMRNSAVEFVDSLLRISGLAQCENKKRFMDSFGGKSEPMPHKPKDFQATFAGNTNDLFCLGLKFTRQAVKLYSSFYNSDIIIASPLGLRLIVAGDKRAADYDFLSSIEVIYMDQVESMQMQSWENMTIIAKHLNLMPKQSHDCDFSRIRPWYLDNKAQLLRQTIMVSSYLTPEIQSVFSRYCHNLQGKLKCKTEYSGVLARKSVPIRQYFLRIECPQYSKDSDARFNHFTSVVLPRVLRGAQSEGTFVFIPNYTDFVRARNYMDKNSMSFATLSEYTSTSQLSRGRTYFADARLKMMLYTQRLHYFRRYSIKGCKHIIFYGLPDDPQFYSEVVGFLTRTALEHQMDPDMLKVEVLFTKWDSLKLERVVGTSRVGKLITGVNDTYEFS